jgi:hypothetical protein
MQGDGVATAIKKANDETSLDLQTSAAMAPQAQFRLVQSTSGGGGILDAFSRALGGPDGPPDVISLSYGGCAIAENTSAPAFTAAATALVDGSQLKAGHPPIGLANGWFYQAAAHPGAFYDVTTGDNDLAGVGCCQAAVGYDLASGIGVPNYAVLPATLPPPG